MTATTDTLCRLYIDADNQPPSLAASLGRLMPALQLTRVIAVVAGNSAGRHVPEWEGNLMSAITGVGVNSRVTKPRRQSADAQLMFELAGLYYVPPDPLELVIVVSRDEHLVAGAEILSARGHRVLLAMAATASAALVSSTVPAVLLPAIAQESRGAAAPEPFAGVQSAPRCPDELPLPLNREASGQQGNSMAQDPVQAKPLSEHAKVIALVRSQGRGLSCGGYAKTEVGAVLAKHGYGKSDRLRLFQQVPTRVAGKKSQEILYFD